MTAAFDPDAFDSAAFETPAETPDTGSGHHPQRYRRPPRIAVDIEDPEEAALVLALLRHRFRI